MLSTIHNALYTLVVYHVVSTTQPSHQPDMLLQIHCCDVY